MKITLQNLMLSLNQIDWSVKRSAHKEAEILLEKIKVNIISTQNSLENLISNNSNSVETPTHFKWYLCGNQKLGYKVWLHEYKPKEIRGTGYAVIPHNHRYWFSSLILKGSFTNSIYQVNKINKHSIKEYILVKEQEFEEGSIYTLSSNIIHTLHSIEEPTITLIIQSKASKSFSESFDFEKETIRRHYSFASRLNEFKNLIKSI